MIFEIWLHFNKLSGIRVEYNIAHTQKWVSLMSGKNAYAIELRE